MEGSFMNKITSFWKVFSSILIHEYQEIINVDGKMFFDEII